MDKKENEPFQFEHTSDFPRLNIEIQRGYPNQIKPPYVSWHFSVWPSQGDHPEEGTNYDNSSVRRINWLKANNKYIRQLIGEDAYKPYGLNRPEEEYVDNYFRGNVLTFSGIACNPALLLRIEFHPEHISYTFYLPIDDPSCPNFQKERTSRQTEFSENYHAKTDKEADKIVLSVWKGIMRASEEEEYETTESDESDIKFRKLAAKFWDQLYDGIWSVAFESLCGELKPPGLVFANFRGITLPRFWLIPAYGENELKRHEFRLDEGEELFVPTDLKDLPYVLSKHQLIEEMRITSDRVLGSEPPITPRRWNRVSAGRALVANSALRQALHWAGGKRPEEDGDKNSDSRQRQRLPHNHRRTVANLVMDGRALYASSLSAAYEDEASKNLAHASLTASRYCVFYCREEERGAQNLLDRRLDRLSLRLHSLGTLRLLALKDLDGLMRVDQKLSHIETKIASAGLKAGTENSIGREKINQIYGDIQNLSEDTIGKVELRTARSAQYSEQFQRIVKNVYKEHKHERIEGFEPYSEFVRRRLYNQFSNIRRIRERLHEARDRLDRILELENLVSTKEITYFTSLTAFFTLVITSSAVILSFNPPLWIKLIILVVVLFAVLVGVYVMRIYIKRTVVGFFDSIRSLFSVKK
jgi:uncharacterized protein DUF3422